VELLDSRPLTRKSLKFTSLGFASGVATALSFGWWFTVADSMSPLSLFVAEFGFYFPVILGVASLTLLIAGLSAAVSALKNHEGVPAILAACLSAAFAVIPAAVFLLFAALLQAFTTLG
jgi:hypothetical protein